jgi:hypothetical protein
MSTKCNCSYRASGLASACVIADIVETAFIHNSNPNFILPRSREL